MTSPGRGRPDTDLPPATSRVRLAAATRLLVASVLAADEATERQLEDALHATERAIEVLGPPSPAATRRSLERQHADYLPRSPVVGTVSPVAPPLSYELLDDRVRAHGRFGIACEGPPGYVHGGWVALAFDELLGMANVHGSHPGMTARLTVRYRRPTPLHAEVRLVAWTERVDGRRITTRGTLDAAGVVTAEAEGLFVSLGTERALEYFGEPPSVPEPTDPLP